MSVSRDKADPDDSILWYWYRNYHPNSKESTKRTVKTSINRFNRYLAVAGGYDADCHWTDVDLDKVPDGVAIRARDVNEVIAEEFLRELKESLAADSQQSTASDLSKCYDWCIKNTVVVEDNPVSYILDEQNRVKLDKPTSRDPYIIDLSEARRVVRSWTHPMWLAIQLLFAKLPRRSGAISNLDIEDLNIDHPGCDWEVHPKVRHWEDHIVFRPEKDSTDPGRKSGNKTATVARYPLDKELKDALIYYLAIRPEPSHPSEPLFLSQMDESRLSAAMITTNYVRKARELGHYYGQKDDDNLNPHYWRHWGTTRYEDRVGGSLTDYMRGDVGRSSKADYNNYTKSKRDQILAEMPKFLEPYIDD